MKNLDYLENSENSEITSLYCKANKQAVNLNLKHFCPENLDKILEESSLTLIDSGAIANEIMFQDYFGGITNRDNNVYRYIPNLLERLIEQYTFWNEAFRERDYVKTTPGVLAQIFNFQEIIQGYLRNVRKRISQCQRNEEDYLHPKTGEFEKIKNNLVLTLLDYANLFQVEREEYAKIKDQVDKCANNHKQDFGTDSQIIASLIYRRVKEDSDKPVLLITADKMMLIEISRACGYVGDAFPEFKQKLHLPVGAWMYSDFNDSNSRFEYKKLSF